MAVTQPWNLVFLAGLVICVLTRGRFARQTRANRITERYVGPREIILLIAVMLTALVVPLLYLFTPLLAFADYELPEWAHWTGLLIMPAALWLFWRSHRDLGLNWSATLEMREGHHVVKHGVYRRIRHPMYAAMWLFSMSQALLLDNWLAGWGVVVAFGFMYFDRVPREESMMRQRFGEEYQTWSRQTGRLFPRLTPGDRARAPR